MHYVYQFIDPELDAVIWDCTLTPSVAKRVAKFDNFGGQLLQEWAEIHFHEPQNHKEIVDQVLWRNSFIKPGGKTVPPFPELPQKGIMRLKDIINAEGTLLSLEELNEKTGCEIPWLWYRGLINAIPAKWKDIMSNQIGYSKGLDRVTRSKLTATKYTCRYLYNLIIDQEAGNICKY